MVSICEVIANKVYLLSRISSHLLPVFFPRLSSETEFQGLLPHAGFFFVYTHFNTADTFPRTSFQREAGVNLQIASGS